MTIPAPDVRTPIPAPDVRTPIVAADVRTSIVAVPPIAIVSIGAIAIPIAMIAIAVVAVPAAVISTAICTSLNSAMDTSNAAGRKGVPDAGSRLVYGQGQTFVLGLMKRYRRCAQHCCPN